VQNNRATTHVIALGRRRILLIEPNDGDHQFLSIISAVWAIPSSRWHTVADHNKAAALVFRVGSDDFLLLFRNGRWNPAGRNVAGSDIAGGTLARMTQS